MYHPVKKKKKTNLDIYWLGGWNPSSTFITASICMLNVIKFVVYTFRIFQSFMI